MTATGRAVSESQARAGLSAEGLTAMAWANGPKDRYAVHAHAYDKVLVALAGSIVFALPGTARSVQLAAGDRLDLPAGTAHGAVVGPEGVTCLEAHLPASALDAGVQHRIGWAIGLADDPSETVDDRMA